MKILYALTFVSAFCLTGAAAAQSQGQRNAINHAAQAMVSTTRCNEIELNTNYMVVLLLGLGIDLSKQPFESVLQERLKIHQQDMRRHTGKDICIVAKMLYGPSGANVPNLIKEK